MHKAFSLLVLFCASTLSLSAQSQIIYGGDWSFANANSTVPNVVGIGPPSTANCQLNPMHRGRPYTRLDPASLGAAMTDSGSPARVHAT